MKYLKTSLENTTHYWLESDVYINFRYISEFYYNNDWNCTIIRVANKDYHFDIKGDVTSKIMEFILSDNKLLEL